MTEEELREIKERLEILYSRVSDMKKEMIKVTDEIFNLELDIVFKLGNISKEE